jgi:hypothetical protein
MFGVSPGNSTGAWGLLEGDALMLAVDPAVLPLADPVVTAPPAGPDADPEAGVPVGMDDVGTVSGSDPALFVPAAVAAFVPATVAAPLSLVTMPFPLLLVWAPG